MNENDGLERGDEIPYKPKICEGQMVPHSHSMDVVEYQYLDKEGAKDFRTNLCSRCVKMDRASGYTMQRTFSEEKS